MVNLHDLFKYHIDLSLVKVNRPSFFTCPDGSGNEAVLGFPFSMGKIDRAIGNQVPQTIGHLNFILFAGN